MGPPGGKCGSGAPRWPRGNSQRLWGSRRLLLPSPAWSPSAPRGQPHSPACRLPPWPAPSRSPCGTSSLWLLRGPERTPPHLAINTYQQSAMLPHLLLSSFCAFLKYFKASYITYFTSTYLSIHLLKPEGLFWSIAEMALAHLTHLLIRNSVVPSTPHLYPTLSQERLCTLLGLTQFPNKIPILHLTHPCFSSQSAPLIRGASLGRLLDFFGFPQP